MAAVTSAPQFIPNAVIIYLGNESNGNVNLLTWENPVTIEKVLQLRCKVCDKTTELTLNMAFEFGNESIWEGLGLKWLADFAFDHKHEKVTFIKKPSTTSTETTGDVVKIKPGQVVHINGKAYDVAAVKDSELVVPLEQSTSGGATVPIMGEFSFHPGGRSMSTVAISQTLLKEIAKLSNFNVDLQAKVLKNIATEYRAVCGQCSNSCPISFDELVGNNRKSDTWVRLTEFCEVHTHIKKVETVEGRKFRDGSN